MNGGSREDIRTFIWGKHSLTKDKIESLSLHAAVSMSCTLAIVLQSYAANFFSPFSSFFVHEHL